MGAVKVAEDEFGGQLCVAACIERICIVPTQMVEKPRRAILHMCAVSEGLAAAKLMAIMQLRLQGWQLQDVRPEPTTAGSARDVWASVPLAPASYFEALKKSCGVL